MKLLKSIAVAVATVGLVACGGGGGGGNSSVNGGTFFTHSELASEFVRNLNVQLDYDVELVKTNTEQFDYIVVYDYDFDTYDAYWIGGYNPGEDILSYLDRNDDIFYYDLDVIGSNLYEDYYTGLIFEKTGAQASAKDLQKIAAVKEGLQINKMADALQAQYGLSVARSQDVARLTVQVANSDSMTDKDYDNFATEILGQSITEFKAATQQALEGNGAELRSMIDNAAEINGITPEDADAIITDVFGASAL